MVLLGFTRLKEKLLDGSKKQTIRKPRKHPFKVGDKLQVYWMLRTKQCEKLGEAVITKIVRKKLERVTEEDARKDGFKNLNDFGRAWMGLHEDAWFDDDVDVITFEWISTEAKA